MFKKFKRRVWQTSLEEKVAETIKKIPKKKQILVKECRWLKKNIWVGGTMSASFLAYFAGMMGKTILNYGKYEKLIECEKNYTMVSRLVAGFKMIASLQPEALLCAGIAGLIAYPILRKRATNYDKQLIEGIENSLINHKTYNHN